MNYNPNTQLTANFTLKEVVEWARHQAMPQEHKDLCIAMCRDHLTSEVFIKAKQVAEKMQELRDAVNQAFPEYNGKLGLRPLSWFRPQAWELMRKRSGKSQHVPGWGVDFAAVNCKPEDYNRIMAHIFNVLLKNFTGGLAYKLNAQGNYSFIHIDLLITTPPRRWQY